VVEAQKQQSKSKETTARRTAGIKPKENHLAAHNRKEVFYLNM
jgi:hypothetical protein